MRHPQNTAVNTAGEGVSFEVPYAIVMAFKIHHWWSDEGTEKDIRLGLPATLKLFCSWRALPNAKGEVSLAGHPTTALYNPHPLHLIVDVFTVLS